MLAALTLPISGLALTVLLASTAGPASAAQADVGLGTGTSFAVLAGSTVTNTGRSVISGDLGVSPGTAITGFPPGQVIGGTIHAADAVALQAQSNLTTAYNDAAGRLPVVTNETGLDLGGQTLVAGVYKADVAMALTGTVTLDAQGDPAAVFIFQAGSTLITASNSTVALVGGAQACHVYWQVGSSATIGTGTSFVGTVMALTSITMQTKASLLGRAMARNGAVTLDNNRITRGDCGLPGTAPSTPATATPTATPTASPSPTPAGSPSPTATSTTPPTGGNGTPTGTGGPGNPGSTGGTGGPGNDGPGAGGPSGPTTTGSGGGDGGGGGSGNGGPGVPVGPGGPGTPRIPTGHPATGYVDDESNSGAAWLLVGLLTLVGASGAGFLAGKVPAPRARRRH